MNNSSTIDKSDSANASVYLKSDGSNIAIAAISYFVSVGGLMRGAYYGYSGGGVNEGGYFSKIEGSREFSLHDYSEVDELESSDPDAFNAFQSMMDEVWSMVEDDEGELLITEAGQGLMLTKGEGNIFMSNGFDSDELEEMSANWSISLRFTS